MNSWRRKVTARGFPAVVLVVAAVLAAATWQPARAADPPAAKAPVPGLYRVGPGDVLRVIVWGEEGLDLVLRVRPDGRITLPMVHDVRAAGKTPEELGQEIAKGLAAFIRHPDVAVIVQEIGSIRLYVLGEVNQQGVLSFSRRPSLLETLAAAGGLTPMARGRILVIHHARGGDLRRQYDLDQVIQGKKGAFDPRLDPGDIVVVQ